jgi:hypothetical protein
LIFLHRNMVYPRTKQLPHLSFLYQRGRCGYLPLPGFSPYKTGCMGRDGKGARRGSLSYMLFGYMD